MDSIIKNRDFAGLHTTLRDLSDLDGNELALLQERLVKKEFKLTDKLGHYRAKNTYSWNSEILY